MYSLWLGDEEEEYDGKVRPMLSRNNADEKAA